jgi:hypothetical protein
MIAFPVQMALAMSDDSMFCSTSRIMLRISCIGSETVAGEGMMGKEPLEVKIPDWNIPDIGTQLRGENPF